MGAHFAYYRHFVVFHVHVFLSFCDSREIMKEIQRLRVEQEAHAKRSSAAEYNPTLLAELRLLRQRKDELESRMQALQESRKELMLQLESLMKLLKVSSSVRHPSFHHSVAVFVVPSLVLIYSFLVLKNLLLKRCIWVEAYCPGVTAAAVEIQAIH